MAETKGSAKKGIGFLTGDRRVEAEGRIEEETGEAPRDAAAVEEAIEEVKEDHGDLGVPNTPR